MIKCTWVVLLLLLTTACSSLGPKASNRFFVEKRWVRNTLQKEHLGAIRQHRFPPLVGDRLIIEANAIDGVVAYERGSAHRRWHLPIKNGVEAGAVLVGDDLLFGASDGFFYNVNAQNGDVRWTYPIRTEGLGIPFALDGVVYFLAGNNVLHALEIKTGKLLWVYTRRDSSNLSIRGGSRPNVVGDTVYVGFSDGYLVAVKKQSGTLMWEASLNRNKRFRDVDAHPVVAGDRIYVSSYDGALYCLNRTDGRVIWTIDDGGESAVTLKGSQLYYSTSTGRTLAVDKDSGKVIWSFSNPGGIAVQPTIYRDMVLVGEMRGDLLFLDQRSGQILASFSPGWGVTAQPVVDDGKGEVYFMSSGANLYSLRMTWRRWAQLWPWETL
ncbi:MAG: PQQ-binding-like beta-propeller repeat protein [Bdellovibrionales bacterium]